MKKTLKFIGVLLFLASCKSETEQRVVGKWQAVQLTECDNLVPIQTELVDIEFTANGKYVFHSTLNVREEGNYRIKKNYLFTQDKLRENAPEKAVLIKSLDADSMVLQMSYKGKDQFLTLAKEGASEKTAQNNQAIALAAGTATTASAAAVALPNNPLDSIQKAEAAKKAEEEKKKQAEAEADKKREAEADRKREEAKKKSKEESSSSSSEAYKKREAKRKAEERKAKEEAEKRAEKFRKEYAKREAEKKKKK